MSATPGGVATAHATADYQPVFTGATKARLEALFARYETKQACLLPALWMVQEARGWIPEQGIAEVAEVLGLTPAYVKGVVTFYTMYHTHPVGRHFVHGLHHLALQHVRGGRRGAGPPQGDRVR